MVFWSFPKNYLSNGLWTRKVQIVQVTQVGRLEFEVTGDLLADGKNACFHGGFRWSLFHRISKLANYVFLFVFRRCHFLINCPFGTYHLAGPWA